MLHHSMNQRRDNTFTTKIWQNKPVRVTHLEACVTWMPIKGIHFSADTHACVSVYRCDRWRVSEATAEIRQTGGALWTPETAPSGLHFVARQLHRLVQIKALYCQVWTLRQVFGLPMWQLNERSPLLQWSHFSTPLTNTVLTRDPHEDKRGLKTAPIYAH